MREKLIDIVECYADFLDWDTKEDMVDSIMDLLATDNNVGHKWIPVSERLPEHFRYVLLWDSADRDFFMGVLRDNNEWYVPGYQDEPFNITHWMPLPEPPKGE